MYIVYIRERYHFSLVRTSKLGSIVFEVKIELQNGALRFREKIDNKCVNFIQFMLSCIVSHGNIP